MATVKEVAAAWKERRSWEKQILRLKGDQRYTSKTDFDIFPPQTECPLFALPQVDIDA